SVASSAWRAGVSRERAHGNANRALRCAALGERSCSEIKGTRSGGRLSAQTENALLLRAWPRRRRFRAGPCHYASAYLLARRRIVEPPSAKVRERQLDLAPFGMALILQHREIL